MKVEDGIQAEEIEQWEYLPAFCNSDLPVGCIIGFTIPEWHEHQAWQVKKQTKTWTYLKLVGVDAKTHKHESGMRIGSVSRVGSDDAFDVGSWKCSISLEGG